MSRLEEIKQNHAVSVHFNSWEDLLLMSVSVDKHINVVCRQYAKECSQASLEKAYFNHEIFTRNGHDEEIFELNKESITNPENIVIL